MSSEGLIQAAGRGTRLGLGPKAFVKLGGVTLLERAVNLLRGRVDRIIVAVAEDDIRAAQNLGLGPDIVFVRGGASRSETTRLLIAAARSRWLILHDVVHPFATPELVQRLFDTARMTGAAAPGIANTEFLYDAAGNVIHAPGSVLIGQKPVAFSREGALAGYAANAREAVSADPSLLAILDRAAIRTAFVEGDPANIKITNSGDLRLAEAIIAVSH